MSEWLVIMTQKMKVLETTQVKMNPKCYCQKESLQLKSKLDKVFFKCREQKCGFFKFMETMDQYDPSKFKRGSCFRCGRYRCDSVDCDEIHDIFGNIINEDVVD